MKNTHPITMNILNQHLVALGKTGSGKSSVMRVIIEQLLDAKKRVCIVDIKGDWYGLKLGADGKSPGYEIMTFGDFKNPDATDIHINENHGAEIAKLIINGNRPCIIGFRGWMPGKVHKFWIDFISTLYNGNKAPLWLAIDEVHNYTPKGKVLSPEIGNSIYWTNKTATEGRGVGLRLVAASQRPQKVHNDFLANCETLIAMRVTHPADKEAFHEWLKEYADDNARGKLVLDSVSKMKTGEAFVWSPEAELFERLKFPMFKTYDSFASPKEGKQRSLKGWASVNLKEVQESLSKVIEESKENDPKELKKKIRDLELANKKLQQTKTSVGIPTDDINKKQSEFIQSKLAEVASHYEKQYQKFIKEVRLIQNVITKNTGPIKQALLALGEIKIPSGTFQQYQFEQYKNNYIRQTKTSASHPNTNTPSQPIQKPISLPGGTKPLDRCGRMILGFLVSNVTKKWTKPQIAVMIGYSLRSSGFKNSISQLNVEGAITKDTSDRYTCTPFHERMKEAHTEDQEFTPSNCLKHLEKCERMIVERFIKNPNLLEDKEQLALSIQYSNTSSGYKNALSKLRTLEIITGSQQIQLTDSFRELL